MKVFLMLMLMYSTANMVYGETNVGDGGGGVERNGAFLTFASAKIKLRPYDSIEDVPGLSQLEKAIANSYLPERHKGPFLQAIRPSGSRRYFVIDKINDEDLASLLEIYKKLNPRIEPQDKIGIYAFTNVTTKETYLLPNFFRLSDDGFQKSAALFHENAWIVANELALNATYKQVIDLEIDFENCLEKTKAKPKFWCSNFYQSAASFFKAKSMIIAAATRYDMENRNLCLYFMNQADEDECSEDIRTFNLGFLFGEKIMQSWIHNRSMLDYALLELRLRELVNSYPNSQTFRELLNLGAHLELRLYVFAGGGYDYEEPITAYYARSDYTKFDLDELTDLTLNLWDFQEKNQLFTRISDKGFFSSVFDTPGYTQFKWQILPFFGIPNYPHQEYGVLLLTAAENSQ